MRKSLKNGYYIILRSWLCLFLILIIAVGFSYYKMLPVIIAYAKSIAETEMLNSANEAVVRILDEQGISYDEIAKLSRDENGNVKSLEIDVYKINNLKSRISSEISKIIAKREEFKLNIPLGNFFDTPYTVGMGPRLPFNMKITTTAFVDFEHEFKSAGINQVLHLINIKININGSFVVVWYRGSISASTTAIAAQTVIVGAVPEAFTNVIEDINDNTAGLINDYGALAGD